MRQELKSVIALQNRGRKDKTKQIKDGATMLNRTQVKPTRNSKKIRGGVTGIRAIAHTCVANLVVGECSRDSGQYRKGV